MNVNRFRIFLLIAFVAALITTTYLAFSTMREMVASWNLPAFASNPFNPKPGEATPTGPGGLPIPNFDLSQPLQSPSGPQAQPWDGNSRVTILLLGLDYRDWEEDYGPPRSDTMIVVTLDPASNTAGMLSIPRDMWVAIPGYGNGKINTAYQLGEAYQVNGGGPGLAIATVELLLGVSIDYYGYVDFNAFVRFIDEIHGIKLTLEDRIRIDLLSGKTKVVQPGTHVFNGEMTLGFVRMRHTKGGDFDRAQRQQMVLLAIRDRIFDLNLLPELIGKAPNLYSQLASGVHTNLTPNDLLKIALALQNVPEENIIRTAIGQDDVTFSTSPDGLDILLPLPENIRTIRDEVFVSLPPVSPVTVNLPLEQLVGQENAKIAVLNGTYTPGLASATSDFLKGEGLNVTKTDNADELYSNTTILDYTGNPYTVQYLVDLLNISPNRIFHSYAPENPVDIEITLGEDWAKSGALTP